MCCVMLRCIIARKPRAIGILSHWGHTPRRLDEKGAMRNRPKDPADALRPMLVLALHHIQILHIKLYMHAGRNAGRNDLQRVLLHQAPGAQSLGNRLRCANLLTVRHSTGCFLRSINQHVYRGLSLTSSDYDVDWVTLLEYDCFAPYFHGG
jgi:hypothetical protein